MKISHNNLRDTPLLIFHNKSVDIIDRMIRHEIRINAAVTREYKQREGKLNRSFQRKLVTEFPFACEYQHLLQC